MLKCSSILECFSASTMSRRKKKKAKYGSTERAGLLLWLTKGGPRSLVSKHRDQATCGLCKLGQHHERKGKRYFQASLNPRQHHGVVPLRNTACKGHVSAQSSKLCYINTLQPLVAYSADSKSWGSLLGGEIDTEPF